MPEPAPAPRAGFVDVVRDFLLAHRALRRLAVLHREGRLDFEEIQGLVGDSDEHLLFRLKERCHALFRDVEPGSTVGREALFDLAVGALFHEAMKLREGVYQQTVYGPKVRALREAAGEGAGELFAAFESMLAAGAQRLEETLEEVETLLYQTRGELHALLLAHRDDGRLARFLVEHGELVEDVFGRTQDEVLAEVLGDPSRAWRDAARSYLESGFFAEAREALREARRRGDAPGLARLEHYAEGMGAYLEQRWAETVESLGHWLDAGPDAGEARFVDLAGAALTKLGELGEPDVSASVSRLATDLAARLRALEPAAAGGDS